MYVKDAEQIWNTQTSITVHNSFQFNSHYEEFSLFETEPHEESRKLIPILKRFTNIHGSPTFLLFQVTSCLILSEKQHISRTHRHNGTRVRQA